MRNVNAVLKERSSPSLILFFVKTLPREDPVPLLNLRAFTDSPVLPVVSTVPETPLNCSLSVVLKSS
jgi:hypothetical protein